MTGFFAEVSSPVLTDLNISYTPSSVFRNITKSTYPVLYDGNEIVIAGIIDSNIQQIEVTGMYNLLLFYIILG